MTNRALNAATSNGNFFDPTNWSPTGVPQSGDYAGITFGDITVSGTLPAGILVGVGGYRRLPQYSTLTLQNATVPVGTTIRASTNFDTYSGSLPAALQFAGTVTNNGTLLLQGGVQTVTLPSGTTLTNNGVIDVEGSAPQWSQPASRSDPGLVNNGLIRVVNPFGQSAQAASFGPIGGTGALSVSFGASLALGTVGAGQTVGFVGGANAGSVVTLTAPGQFAATTTGFVAGDTIVLANTAETTATYTPSGSGSGTLQIFDGGTAPVASLAFSGTYAISDFTIAASGTSLNITTDITNPATGSTAAPTSTGVFRFFDTTDGTHFFTGSVTERDTILAERPDLVEESNGFGAVTTASAVTTPVFRFFDTVHGTHFFTASTSERDQVIATRPDLQFEPSATFLEHTTAQSGDVAVYRLFSTTDGTHLYTGSSSELSALTTPGGAGYRADLVSEGVGFYAPAGTYT